MFYGFSFGFPPLSRIYNCPSVSLADWFWDCPWIPKYIEFTLVDYDGYFISSKGFLPAVIDIMVI